ncbi:N-carbamoyl-L-amino acid hydrolase [Teratosphaeria destructans]|uniref:N-carbamoyl-L-amino acid hydrolase n=1 Tax=Teratosphaeria destructans TaxID=418781 RepID=A0A9W7VYT0_9PEZI|nr:N-carbamoyl-L-amino acid hydrolase [Teratosphaeria destructans]
MSSISLITRIQRAHAAASRNVLSSCGHAARWQTCRPFHATRRRSIAVLDFTEKNWSDLRIDQDRLMKDIHSTCRWGRGERWGSGETEVGMSRLSLSDVDKQARDWFHETCTSLGCKVHTDVMGNQFAVRPGLNNHAPPTYAGSHLDTQPTGGRYDGILGVTAAVEMLRVLNDNSVETAFPVGAVNWTNEEGARFPMSMVSSGVWSGDIPLERAHNLKSVIPHNHTATMKSELQRIGYLGTVPASWQATKMAAHFELHIEQGPILEAENRRVGIVQGVQSYKWFTLTVKGRDSHTGATSFQHRADALLTASKMILASHKIASKHGALASTGILNLKPGSTNTVPGFVQFSLDIRSPLDETVDTVEAECKAAFSALAAGENLMSINDGCTPSSRSCTVNWQTDFVSPATHFHGDNINCVLEAGRDLCGNAEVSDKDIGSWGKLMTSGAGHDSVYTNKRCPTSMIFVPCRDGVSHNPAEYCSPAACADGANVLLGAVLRYDHLRHTRGH